MLIPLFLLIVTQKSLSFPGGDIHALVSSIETLAEKPVVATCNDTLFRKFSFSINDPKDLLRILRVKTGLESSDKNAYGLSFGCLSNELYSRKLKRNSQASSLIFKSTLVINEGVISGKSTSDKIFRVSNLRKLPWSKPLKIHWAFEDYPLAFSASKVTEIQFLTAVADAIGAKLSSTDKEFALDFDPIEFRKRAVSSLTGTEPYEPSYSLKDLHEFQARELLGAQLLRGATNKQLLDAFVKPGSGFLVDGPVGSPLFSASVRLITSIQEYTTQTDRDHISASNGFRRLLGLVDTSQPLKGMFCSPMQFSVMARAKDGGSVSF